VLGEATLLRLAPTFETEFMTSGYNSAAPRIIESNQMTIMHSGYNESFCTEKEKYIQLPT
jgi:hypothetical protein